VFVVLSDGLDALWQLVNFDHVAPSPETKSSIARTNCTQKNYSNPVDGILPISELSPQNCQSLQQIAET
jgi:hypothetical protein